MELRYRRLLAFIVPGLGLALSLPEPRPALALPHQGEDVSVTSAAYAVPPIRAWAGSISHWVARGPTMIRVPGGDFWIGSTEAEVVDAMATCKREAARVFPAISNLGERETSDPCQQSQFTVELWRHRAHLGSFWIDRTEVTVAAYERCVETSRCRALPYPLGAERFSFPDYPATLITHDEARAYCHYRGGRLPTEAEWERTARGSHGRAYPWGNLWNSRVNNHGRLGWDPTDASDGYAELAPVGSFPDGQTPNGILDLAGNVAEWVEDRFIPGYPRPSPKPRRSSSGAGAASSTSLRVARGGDWSTPRSALRGAARQPQATEMRAPTLGFRCARTIRAQTESKGP